MLTLYLVRHGKSSWSRPLLRDHDRPLSRRGRDASKLIADYVNQSLPLPGLVLASTAARTLETAEVLAARWTPSPPVVADSSLYLATPAEMLKRIRSVTDARVLMLVGHNPGTAELGQLLAGDRSAFGAKFPTGALAAISFAVDDWALADLGDGQLKAFVQPRDLVRQPH